MSDISIPGISSRSGIDTTQVIQDLMEVEGIPVRRMEREVDTYELQRVVWQDLGRGIGRLRDAARTLYSFENPFRERLAESDNPSVVTATANRQAIEGNEEITVVEVAGRDRFASRAIERGYEIPAGRYGFTLGDESVSVRFSGGGARDFAEAINRGAEDAVRVTVVPRTSDSQVLVFEGQRTGADAQLGFTEASEALAESIGVMAPERPEQSIALLVDQPLRLEPGAGDEIMLDRRFGVAEGMVLRFQARTETLEREPWSPPPTPPGPTLPPAGSVTLGGVTVRNDELGLDLPDAETPEAPTVVEDNRVIALSTSGTTVELPAVPESTTFQTVEIAAADLPSSIDGFSFANRNTGRAIEIRNIEVLDPNARGGSRPNYVLNSASDARIMYSGVEVQRSSNEIDDLIPGVTLSLHRALDEPVEISVQPDRETAKDSIIQFIGFYNQVVRDINIYTRNEPSLIDQIEYFEESERETMEERLGIFQGDSSLNTLRTRLQTVMMNPYDPGADGSYRLLAQVGISTNASGAGSGFDASRLRGYLEISEAQLDQALQSDFAGVERLFASDSDGDLVRDSGVAVALDSFVAPYVQTGGIVASRTQGLDTRIDRTESDIARYNDRLEDYEQQLRTDFGRMESAIEGLDDIGRQLDSLQGIGGGSNQ